MTNPAGGSPGQGGWVQMPVPTDQQIQQAQRGPMQSADYAPIQQSYQQNQQNQQQPQYQMPQTQVQHSNEPYSQTPAPNLQPQRVEQRPQQLPPSQQQPYLAQQPQQVPYQQQQQTQQQFQQQPHQRLGYQQQAGLQLDAQGRVTAQPGVPPELVGRSLGDVLNLYNTMRQTYVQSQLQEENQQQRQQPQQPTSQQVPAQAKASDFWSDPIGTMERVIDRKMQPITQNSQAQQIHGARDAVASVISDFAQYEAGVIQRLRGMSPDVLADPRSWQHMYFVEKGERELQQKMNGGNQNRQGFQQVPVQSNGSSWQPAQPVGSFFTESPTAPNSEQVNAQQQLSPDEIIMAGKFGRTPEQWYAAKQGRF